MLASEVKLYQNIILYS